MIKPAFFKTITVENGYELSENICYKRFDTTMDYLQQCIASVNYRQARARKKTVVPFMDIIRQPTSGVRSGYYTRQRDEILNAVRECRCEISQAYIGYETKDKLAREEVKQLVCELKQHYIDIIDSMSSHEYLMYIVLKEIEKPDNAAIRSVMFDILFGKPNETFMRMIASSREPIYQLIEDTNGSEQYYSFKFSRAEYNDAA